MKIADIRDRLLTLFAPIIIVGLVLGYSVWLLGTRFFWDTSTLAVLVSPEGQTTARIEIEANIVDYDLTLPSFLHYGLTLLATGEVSKTYPINFSLPWSKTVICSEGICFFSSLPSGKASLTISSNEADIETQNATIQVAPDTNGELDLRPSVSVTEIEDISTFLGSHLTDTDRAALDGAIYVTNRFHSLVVVRGSSGEILYDILSRQAIRLPDSIDANNVARTDIDGKFLILTDEGVYLFDRFGRTPFARIDRYDVGDMSFLWSDHSTRVILDSRQRDFVGWWWPLNREEKTYLTNGTRIIELK